MTVGADEVSNCGGVRISLSDNDGLAAELETIRFAVIEGSAGSHTAIWGGSGWDKGLLTSCICLDEAIWVNLVDVAGGNSGLGPCETSADHTVGGWLGHLA